MESQNIEYKQPWQAQWSGIQRILTACQTDNLQTPIVEENTGGLQITIFTTPQNTPQNTPQKDNLSNRILSAIQDQPTITQQALAKQLGISFNTVKEYISKLKQTGRLKRIGPDRGGYWLVIE